MGNCFGSTGKASTKKARASERPREARFPKRGPERRPATSSGHVLGSAAAATLAEERAEQREVLARAAEQRASKQRRQASPVTVRVRPAGHGGEQLSPAEQRRQESLLRDWQS